MNQITTIGLDISKNVFDVHGVSAEGTVVLRKRLRRGHVVEFFAALPPCLVGLEACASAHHWSRELAACGHDVRQMPAQYVKPYVKRNKNDRADAEACCEAVQRPGMRFVPAKTPAQQAELVAHRVRDLLMRQRTALINTLRAHMAEFGIIAPKQPIKTAELKAVIADASDARLPAVARMALKEVVAQLDALERRTIEVEKQIVRRLKTDPVAKHLLTVPGIGPIGAALLRATVPDPTIFASGRAFAAWLGLTPRQRSTGGRTKLGHVSKRGNGHIRRVLVIGAVSTIFGSRRMGGDPWLAQLRGRKPLFVTAVALANKMARICWAVMVRGTDYRVPAAA